MSKPFEEEWQGKENWIAGPDGGVVFELHLDAGPERDAYRTLAVAAPVMARALRIVLDGVLRWPGTDEDATVRKWCEEALTKAGVPLP